MCRSRDGDDLVTVTVTAHADSLVSEGSSREKLGSVGVPSDGGGEDGGEFEQRVLLAAGTEGVSGGVHVVGATSRWPRAAGRRWRQGSS